MAWRRGVKLWDACPVTATDAPHQKTVPQVYKEVWRLVDISKYTLVAVNAFSIVTVTRTFTNTNQAITKTMNAFNRLTSTINRYLTLFSDQQIIDQRTK